MTGLRKSPPLNRETEKGGLPSKPVVAEATGQAGEPPKATSPREDQLRAVETDATGFQHDYNTHSMADVQYSGHPVASCVAVR